MSFISDFLDVQRGKAISDHPAFHDGAPVVTYAVGANREDARISQGEARRHLDGYGGAQAIDWVYDCANLYAETASTAEWHLERDGKRLLNRKQHDSDPSAEIAPQQLVDLLEKPNPYMDYAELIELLVIDLLLVGNAYWLKYRQTSDGKPLALYRLSPLHVKIIPSPQGPKRYEYQPPGAREPLELGLDEVMHFRRPNPHSNYYGLGVIAGGGRPFDMELALTDTQASYYENKADPSLIVQSDRRIPRDVLSKLNMQLRGRAAGSKNAGALLLLESGLKASTLTPNAQQAMFEQLTKLSRDRIFAMFRTSPMLFGILDEPAGAIKPTDARREFDNKTMRPFLNKLQSRITDGLTAAWGLDFVVDYGYVIPQEDLVKLGGDFSAIPGVKVREVRKFLGPLGLEESTGDPEIDDLVLNLPGNNADPTGQPLDNANGAVPGQGEVGGPTGPTLADRPVGSEPGRPPAPSKTAAFPKKGQPLPAGARVRKPKKASGKAFDPEAALATLAVLESRKPEGKAVKLTGEKRPPDLAEAQRVKDVDALAAELAADLQSAVHTLERELLDIAEGKALPSLSELKSKVRRSGAWGSFADKVTAALRKFATQAVSMGALHTATTYDIPAGSLDYATIVDDVLARADGPDSISSTLLSKIVADLDKLDSNDRDAVNSAIQSNIRDWKDSQTSIISMTEITAAYNSGVLNAGESAGVSEWLVSDGHDFDEPCAEADGQVWTTAHALGNLYEHPNCRRGFVPILEK